MPDHPRAGQQAIGTVIISPIPLIYIYAHLLLQVPTFVTKAILTTQAGPNTPDS